ncbi:MAG: hypothetical protein KGJ06_00195, partial [Pseudomonadota bacterium]|nr:hypothetical protein [Pseudomonadota bacterium]
ELSRRISQEQAPCADEFKATLAELQDVADSFRFSQQSSYALAFASGSAQLTAEDKDTIEKIAAEAHKAKSYLVEIQASEGMGSRQQKLFARRLSAARHALLKAGIAGRNLRIRKEETSKEVHLSCDVVPEERTVTVLLKTPGGEEK